MHGDWNKCRVVAPVSILSPLITIHDSDKYQLPPGTPTAKYSHPHISLTDAEIEVDLSFIDECNPTKQNHTRNVFKLNTKFTRMCGVRQFKSSALEKEFQRYHQHHYIPLIYIYIISYFVINISVYFAHERRLISNPQIVSIVCILRAFICILLLLFIVLFVCKVCIRISKRCQAMLWFNIILPISELFICAISGVPDHMYHHVMLLLLFVHMFSGLRATSACIISWSITIAFTIMAYLFRDWRFFYTSVPYLIVTALCLSVLSLCIEFNARNGFLKLVELRIQKRISKQSLSMLLPPHVAQWLRMGRRMAVKFTYNLNDPNPKYHGVSVMFCEICNFERLVSRLSPHSLISTLNKVFTRWDDYIQLHKLWKLKTINEVYIAAGGLPYPAVDESDPFHCIRMVFCANDLMYYCNEVLNVVAPEENEIPITKWTEDEMEQYEQKQFKPQPSPVRPEPLQIRIGLNIGPVVAGVIGKKLPRYDLFGDTINVAARMKSTCQPSEIQISQAFYDALPDAFHASMKERKGVEVKGKGKMDTFLMQYMDRNKPLDARIPRRGNKSKHFRQMPIIPSETSVDFDEIMDPESARLFFETTRVRSISATHKPMPTDIGPTLLDVLAGQLADIDLDSDSDTAYALLESTECVLQENDNKIPYSE